MTPRVFDKYQIIRRIAVGGMGEVFLARQTGLPGFERQVILKSLLQGDGQAPPEMVKRFMDEARVAASLNHPNVVSVFEAGVWSGTFFIAMEYIPGWNLSQLTRDFSVARLTLPALLAARIVHDAALGLHHAHGATDTSGASLGIVHRDVSPQNIMVRRDGLTKVVDFGVAWALSRESKTRTGSVVGKLAYMAPEQLRGERLDPHCDQYALGIVLWELLTGARLYGGKNEAETMKAVLTRRPMPPSELVPAVPSELSEVAMRMLEESPRRRFVDCGEVAAALDVLLSKTPADASQAALARALEPIGPVPAERDATLGGDFVVKLKSEDGQSVIQVKSEDVVVSATQPGPTTPERAIPSSPPPRRGRGPFWAIAAAAAVFAAGSVVAVMATPTVTQQEPLPTPPPVQTAAPLPAVADAAVDIIAEAPAVTPREAPPVHRVKRTAVAAPVPKPAEPVETAAAPAQLTIGTKPWTFAFLDGRSLGSTPVHKASVSAGKHTLVLDNEDEGIHRVVPLELKPAEFKKLDLDLTKK